MTTTEKLLDLKQRMQTNLEECILPVWRDHAIDGVNGGYLGKINEDLSPDYEYPKALVLATRMLWTYCNAYRLLGDEKYKELAEIGFEYLKTKFWDEIYGGAYFMMTPDYQPLTLEKRTYGQAFIIYSFAEYYRTFGDQEALDKAMFVFRKCIETLKTPSGGYIDTIGRDWKYDPLGAVWWMNPHGAPLLLNSHLHLFEASIALFRVTGDPEVRTVLRDLLVFLMDKVVDHERHHLKAGMDTDGGRMDDEISYGHDSECSYLMTDAAKMLGEPELIQRATEIADDLMGHVLAEGIDTTYGGVFYEYRFRSDEMNRTKIWWVQAEALTGFVNAYAVTGKECYLDAARGVWDYVENNLVDHRYGEWFSYGPMPYTDEASIRYQKDREVRCGREKANRVKCPYHDSRTCMEIMERVDALLAAAQ